MGIFHFKDGCAIYLTKINYFSTKGTRKKMIYLLFGLDRYLVAQRIPSFAARKLLQMQDSFSSFYSRSQSKWPLRETFLRSNGLSCAIMRALTPDPALGPQEESKIPAGSAAHERSSSMIRAPAIWCDRANRRAQEPLGD